jgi:ribosomal protein S18 acetylase RimI-like enzyme
MSQHPITLRPVTDADSDFLLAVYATTRAHEMTLVPWTAEQKAAFVRMQFQAQSTHYAAEYPTAQHAVIYCADAMAGRIYLDTETETLHILDVTILPQYRNRGIGSQLLHQVLEQARALGKPVTIYVETYNPSLRLFERMGFQRAEEKGLSFLLKWNPEK